MSEHPAEHPERAFIRRVIAEGGAGVPVPTNPLAQALSMTVEHAAPGRVRAAFRADRRFTQGNGVIQGGILSAMLDFGMAFAAFSVAEAGVTVATVSQTTSFFRPAPPGGFTVEAEVEKAGRTVIHTRAVIYDGTGQAVAAATAPLAVVPMRV